MNGHIIGFRLQTQELESPYKTPSNTLAVKGLIKNIRQKITKPKTAPPPPKLSHTKQKADKQTATKKKLLTFGSGIQYRYFTDAVSNWRGIF